MTDTLTVRPAEDDDWMTVPQPGRVAVAQNRRGTVLGTAPGAFDHPRNGRVGLHILWKKL